MQRRLYATADPWIPSTLNYGILRASAEQKIRLSNSNQRQGCQRTASIPVKLTPMFLAEQNMFERY